MAEQAFKTTITRTIEIDVEVGHVPERRESWDDPGDPAEWWVDQATNAATGDAVTLTLAEIEQAIEQCANPPKGPDLGDIVRRITLETYPELNREPEPDDDRPF